MSASYCIVKEQQELRKNLRDRLSHELRKLWPHLRIQLQQSSLRKNKILTQLGHSTGLAWGTFCHRVSGSHSTTCMKSGRHSGPEETWQVDQLGPLPHIYHTFKEFWYVLITPRLIGMLKIVCFHCTHQNSVEDAPATIPTSVFGGKSARTCSWASSFCCQQCQQCTFGHQKKITCSLNHRIAIVPYRTFVLRRRNGRSLAVIPRPKTKTQKHRKLIIHDIGFRTLHAAVGWSRASLEISQPCPIGNIKISHPPMPCSRLQVMVRRWMFCWVQSVHVSHGTLPPATGSWPRGPTQQSVREARDRMVLTSRWF